jgi:hypothetical protein
MTRRLWAVALALVLFGAACGTDPNEEVQSDGDQVVRDVNSAYLAEAAADALEESSGRFEMSVHQAGDLMGMEIDMTMTATGEWNESQDAYRMSMDMGTALADMADSMGEDPGSLGFPADLTMEVIQIGDTTYMRGGTFAMLGVGEGEWVKSDLSDMSGGSIQLGGMGGTADPAAYLQLVQGASGAVEELGLVDVRGVETTGYRVVSDLGEVMELSSGDEAARTELEQFYEQLGFSDFLDAEMPIEVYVDADGGVRRVIVDYDVDEMFGALFEQLGRETGEELPELGDLGSLRVTSTTDYFDVGAADVAIVAPPAEAVVDASELESPPIQFADVGDAVTGED